MSVAFLLLWGCKKDKFTTAPQISFKSFSPNAYSNSTADENLPVLTIKVTDAEGDLGTKAGKDTSYIYFTNLRTNRFDSVMLPDITAIALKNFDAEIKVNLKQFLGVPNNSKRDTIFFDVYVKDFAKNKSNVLKTDQPVFYFP
jgi:hypothetical protein